jgi:FlaA1/EpsC-like NDP-sugar epimerase
VASTGQMKRPLDIKARGEGCFVAMNPTISQSFSINAVAAFKGKRVLVTGACGTVGRELVRQLLVYGEVGSLTALDHNESELMFLEEEHSANNRVRFMLSDVRDLASLLRETRNIDILFHAAAYKHVYLCERSPLEAIQTNILGVQNVIQAAVENGVQRLVFTSSDKAVNPTNVMGTSKLMGERLITAAALHPDLPAAHFLSTRFGNVLGSRGSVIPLFREQIKQGGPVTLSDPRMTRFIMSLDQAVKLVIESVPIAQPGDVLVTKMPAIRISDLAEVMIRELAPLCGRNSDAIEIVVRGQRPGEKLYEELMNEEETRRSFELEQYFVVRPAMSKASSKLAISYDSEQLTPVDRPYNSANVPFMSQQELTAFLITNGLLDDNRNNPEEFH